MKQNNKINKLTTKKMKKKVIISVVLAAFVAFAGYNVYVSKSEKTQMATLTLENVEALADGEGDPNAKYECRLYLTRICTAGNKDRYFYRTAKVE